MSLGFASPQMSAKRKTPSTQKMTSIRIAEEVVEIARVVAAAEGVAVYDLITDILRPILLERRRGLVEKWAKEAQPEPKSPKGKGQN